MRISDWIQTCALPISSAPRRCRPASQRGGRSGRNQAPAPEPRLPAVRHIWLARVPGRRRPPHPTRAPPAARRQAPLASAPAVDRKHVEVGKIVSVSDDHGGLLPLNTNKISIYIK